MEKYLSVENKTEYSNPLYTRKRNRVLNPALYCIQKTKHKSYFIRSYYEYLDTIDKKGKAFFVTATFAPESLPNFCGVDCFDYSLYRRFVSRFRKKLERKYNYSSKFFCVNELGTQKHRPHHHIICYITDKSGEVVNITGRQFLKLFSDHWKFGFCFPGKYGCEVINFRAFNYLCKYICKSIESQYASNCVYNNSYNDTYESLIHSKSFFDKWLEHSKELSAPLRSDLPDTDDYRVLYKYFRDFESNPRFDMYCKLKAHCVACDNVREFEQHHSIKPRVSRGLGLCLADPDSKFYVDPFNPLVQVPSKHGYKLEKIPLYIYRKLYTDVFIDYTTGVKYETVKIGNRKVRKLVECDIPVRHYKLNEDGLNRKFVDFYESLDDDVINTHSLLHTLGIRVDSHIVKSYLLYNTIYRDRLFKVGSEPDLNFHRDYYECLISGFEFDKTSKLSDQDLSQYCDYINHSYFYDLKPCLELLDSAISQSYINHDEQLRDEFERLKKVKDNYNRLTNYY